MCVVVVGGPWHLKAFAGWLFASCGGACFPVAPIGGTGGSRKGRASAASKEPDGDATRV